MRFWMAVWNQYRHGCELASPSDHAGRDSPFPTSEIRIRAAARPIIGDCRVGLPISPCATRRVRRSSLTATLTHDAPRPKPPTQVQLGVVVQHDFRVID